MYEGVCPVVNVPFREDLSIDFKGLKNIVDHTVAQGVGSICLFAFNSEPYKLSFSEKILTIRKFLEFVDKRIPTLIGLVENSVADCTELGLAAKEGGADGVILYPPALSTPSGDALIDYFRRIADAVDLKVMIQDNPRSTGVTMSMEFLVSAYESIKQFEYLKVECPIPMRKLRAILDKTNGEMKCYSGNGGIFAVDAFLSGATGIMPGVVLGGKFNEMYSLFAGNEVDKARALFEKILPFAWYEDQSLEFYIACEKYILKELGIIECDAVRAPGTVLSDIEKKELMTLYNRL